MHCHHGAYVIEKQNGRYEDHESVYDRQHDLLFELEDKADLKNE